MPPTRQPGHSPGPRLTAAPALASALRPRRCSSGDSDRDSPASLRSRSRGAASSSLPVPLFRRLLCLLWSRGQQTSTCCWRSPRTETGNPDQGENPGGVEAGEGSCGNLPGPTQLLGLSTCPRLLASLPSPSPRSPRIPASPPRSRSLAPDGASRSAASPPSNNTDHSLGGQRTREAAAVEQVSRGGLLIINIP